MSSKISVFPYLTAANFCEVYLKMFVNPRCVDIIRITNYCELNTYNAYYETVVCVY